MFRMGGMTHCGDCDWKSEGNNAMGTGAQHHYKTGHKVFVEVYWGHIYDSDPLRMVRVVSKALHGPERGENGQDV